MNSEFSVGNDSIADDNSVSADVMSDDETRGPQAADHVLGGAGTEGHQDPVRDGATILGEQLQDVNAIANGNVDLTNTNTMIQISPSALQELIAAIVKTTMDSWKLQQGGTMQGSGSQGVAGQGPTTNGMTTPRRASPTGVQIKQTRSGLRKSSKSPTAAGRNLSPGNLNGASGHGRSRSADSKLQKTRMAPPKTPPPPSHGKTMTQAVSQVTKSMQVTAQTGTPTANNNPSGTPQTNTATASQQQMNFQQGQSNPTSVQQEPMRLEDLATALSSMSLKPELLNEDSNLSDWIENMDVVVEAKKLSGKNLQCLLQANLKGRYRDWWKSLKEPLQTWPEVRATLQATFKRRKDDCDRWRTLTELRQGKHEPPIDFIHKMVRNFNGLTCKPPESNQIALIVDKMNERCRLYLVNCRVKLYKTLMEAVAEMPNFMRFPTPPENSKTKVHQRHDGRNRTSNQSRQDDGSSNRHGVDLREPQTEDASAAENEKPDDGQKEDKKPERRNRQRNVNCFRCGEGGHIARNCEAPMPAPQEKLGKIGGS